MIREELDYSEQPEHEANNVDRSDNRAYILLEMVLTWCSVLKILTTATRLKRGQAAVLSFDWIAEAEQRWGVKKKKRGRGICWDKAATKNKIWPRSRCSPIVILHAIWTTLVKLEKTPPVPHKTTEDGQAAGRQIKWRLSVTTFLFCSRQRPKLFVCIQPHELDH